MEESSAGNLTCEMPTNGNKLNNIYKLQAAFWKHGIRIGPLWLGRFARKQNTRVDLLSHVTVAQETFQNGRMESSKYRQILK